MLLVLRFLEGRANGILRAGGKAGADRNRARTAVAFAVVIYAVMHVAMDALDVLLAAAARTILLIVHSEYLLICCFVGNIITANPIFPRQERAYTVSRCNLTFKGGADGHLYHCRFASIDQLRTS